MGAGVGAGAGAATAEGAGGALSHLWAAMATRSTGSSASSPTSRAAFGADAPDDAPMVYYFGPRRDVAPPPP